MISKPIESDFQSPPSQQGRFSKSVLGKSDKNGKDLPRDPHQDLSHQVNGCSDRCRHERQ
jgi:hypothetical protein